MPLIKSGSKDAFKANVKTLMGDVGKSPHVKTRDQALAIAYNVKREGRAHGGGVFSGPIISTVAGRTDHHPMNVKSGSYVLPADHVSSYGQGNTLAGMKYLKTLGPQGIKKVAGAYQLPKLPMPKGRKDGGAVDTETPVPINAAGGEMVLTPEEVTEIGDGDLARGHAVLDNWVVQNRKKHIKTLSKLPGPAKD